MKLTNAQSSLEFDCQDTLEVIDIYVIFPGELTSNERNDAAEHMLACKSCRDKYLGMKLTDTALRVNRDWLIEQGVFNKPQTSKPQDQSSDKEITELRFETMMGRALARRKRREQRERIVRAKGMLKPVAAVAACLIIAIGVYLTVSQLTGTRSTSAPTVAVQPSAGSVKIELLTGSGSEIISASQSIIASSGLKTLRINGNRQMVLNAGTQLSVVPHNLGCIVKLDKGEIYTEVKHDGKPFVVESIHGRAVITGTIFNIKTDDKQMELAVTEGTVSFENDKGSANVMAGHKSVSALNSKPTKPLLCDTKQLIAWATGNGKLQEITATAFYQPELDMLLTFDSEQIDLEGIDYDSWINQKRDWFKREFPHIFRFKNALANEDIQTDYPELLMKSGDIWQFAYPEKTCTQLIPATYESMANLASAYGKNKQWVSDNLLISHTHPVSKGEAVSLKAFDRWGDALEEASNSPSQISSELLAYSLHASVYLSETRMLAWLAVNDGHIAVTAVKKTELQKLLEQEIKAASSCVKQFKQLFVCGDSPNACDEYEHRELLQELIDDIKTIVEIERKLPEYEVISK